MAPSLAWQRSTAIGVMAAVARAGGIGLARREFERGLHDGAQQQLVASKVKLGAARSLAHMNGAERAADLIEGLIGDANTATETLRDLARGMYPTLLDAEGLVTAIEAQADKAPLAVSVEAENVSRNPLEVETSIYFCVLEALDNVVEHAGTDRVRIAVGDVDGRLSFSVADDGVGLERSQTALGTGLLEMAERLDTVGGTIAIVSEPGEGTTVNGMVPVPEVVAV